MTTTARSVELHAIGQAIADALPPTALEVVLTGSVSRGVADGVSDIELLVVTRDELELDDCFSLATACGLRELGTWGRQGGPTKRVSGYRDGAPIELIWWSLGHAETAVDAIFVDDSSTTADALASSRNDTSQRQRRYPLARAIAERASGGGPASRNSCRLGRGSAGLSCSISPRIGRGVRFSIRSMYVTGSPTVAVRAMIRVTRNLGRWRSVPAHPTATDASSSVEAW